MTQNEKELIALLREAHKLGLRFFIGSAYISRAYIDHQDDLNERIFQLIEKIEVKRE
jgi:hypothetical protein